MLPTLPEPTSKHVGNATELTCLIPIKQRFLPTFETWTYAGRLRVVFKVLHALRQNSRESRSVKPVLDIVDAAGTVHAFTWAVVQERFLMLNVVFDRPWEPYIRVIWRDLGPLLDLFLCNCEEFQPSTEGFETFAAYVRKHQIDSAFFYPASSLSIDDQRYLTQFEKAQRDAPGRFERVALELAAKGPAAQAAEARAQEPAEARAQWLLALEALFTLRNLFPALPKDAESGEDDPGHHEILRRAARKLLKDSRPPHVAETEAIKWFGPEEEEEVSQGGGRPDLAFVQGGILAPYRRVSHGCLLLARIEQPDEARTFVAMLADQVTTEANTPKDAGTCVNLAFTFAGLQRLGVSQTELLEFPKEFREGMEARAGLLGDVRDNHPDRWVFPRWNVDATPHGVTFLDDVAADAPTRPPVRTSGIDLVITLHAQSCWDNEVYDCVASHPLYNRARTLCASALANGVRVVSIQPLRRFSAKREGGAPPDGAPPPVLSRDHFGLVDGISQPDPLSGRDPFGELLVGFNSRRDPKFETTKSVPKDSLQHSGSFLVVRKLRQNVDALKKAIASAPPDLQEELLDKMVGRRKDGSPLHQKPGSSQWNDFNFGADAGVTCPFHSHIRRANPRLGDDTKPPVPVIARRGLSYGPHFDDRPDVSDRGMMFMAYNASIAEQFEMIQRWMSGGNAPAAKGAVGTYGGQPDPMLGLPDADGKRTYRFVDVSGTPRTVDLGATPFVTLEWGLYLFTPSKEALRRLAEAPGSKAADLQRLVQEGLRVIEQLKTPDQWASLLEGQLANQTGITAAVFAAIRGEHRGALRTPYGIVVASHDLGMQVLKDDETFSVREYQRRFDKTVGKGYLGMDSGPAYDAASAGPNKALQEVLEADAFAEAYRRTLAKLAEVKVGAVVQALPILSADGGAPAGPPQAHSVPVRLEPVIDSVLGQLAQLWFDIPDGTEIKAGGPLVPGDTTLRCPASFVPPSRYVFSSPHPRAAVERLAIDQGARLLEKVHAFVTAHREAQRQTGDAGVSGVIAKKLFTLPVESNDELARILLGLVFGFVPTVYGNALQVLGAWLADETFWRLQQAVLAAGTPHERAEILRKPIEDAVQMRPVPGLLHREATRDTTIGGVAVKADERVVLAIGGMTQDLLADDRTDVTTVFGGDRSQDNHPTHACPGRHLAMGVLSGMLAGILSGVGVASPAPALFTVRARVEPDEMQSVQAVLQRSQAQV